MSQPEEEEEERKIERKVYELKIETIPRNAQIGIIGCSFSGKSTVARSLVQRMKCEKICIVSPDRKGYYARTFGGTCVVQTTTHPLYQEANSIIIDEMMPDRAFVMALPEMERGKLRIVSVPYVHNMSLRCRAHLDYIFLTRTTNVLEIEKQRKRFCPHIPEGEWNDLVRAVTNDPLHLFRVLVVSRPTDTIYWYQSNVKPKDINGCITEFDPDRSPPFLDIQNVVRVSTMLTLQDAVAMYSTNTGLYNHIVDYLSRLPGYKRRKPRLVFASTTTKSRRPFLNTDIISKIAMMLPLQDLCISIEPLQSSTIIALPISKV